MKSPTMERHEESDGTHRHPLLDPIPGRLLDPSYQSSIIYNALERLAGR